MKKFLKNILIFSTIIIVVNCIYLFILLNYSLGFKKVYEMSKFKNKEYELIVLGNSMALDGIDSKYISERGIKTYTSALAGNHISTNLFLLQNYLQNNHKPKMVLIGMSSAVGKSYLNPVPFDNPEVDFFYKSNLWDNIKDPPLLNFQWLAIDMVKVMISKEHRNATMENGQWRTRKIVPDNSHFNPEREDPDGYDNPYLQKIVYLCEKNNIKLIFVEMTGSVMSQNSVPFEKVVAISKTQNIKIYNLNNHQIASSIIDPQTDFLSANHLNVFGAKKETKFLFETVIQPNFTK